jgi:predicted ATPase
MPFFDDFRLDVINMGEKDMVRLSWQQKGSDFPMQPYHLSDGSIRFICLATALLNPFPPSVIVIDEPELGLHPEAIRILGELIRDAAKRTQIIVATQSPLLLDQFSIEDIVVVNRREGQSVFERLHRADFDEWLENYSVGELWSRNIIAGGTCHE